VTSSRPYFIRAIHEWISDNALTPHVIVDAKKPGVQVPQQYVKDGKIVLNIASAAVVNLMMTNEWVNFDARFSGVEHRIRLPVASITAIYAAENGRGMFFDEAEMPDGDGGSTGSGGDGGVKGKPSLKIVK